MANTEKMEITHFWNLVAQINWAATEEDSEKVDEYTLRGKRILMGALSAEEAREFSWRLETLQGALARVVRAWERDTGKDCDLYGDSWGDLLAHIVGCGREVYEANLASPELVYERAQDWKRWKECFAYCVPGRDDYEMRDGDLLPRRAAKYLEELEDSPEMDSPQTEALERVRVFLRAVIGGGAIEAARNDAAAGFAVKADMKALREWHNALIKRMAGPRAFVFSSGLFHHGIENLASDAREIFG